MVVSHRKQRVHGGGPATGKSESKIEGLLLYIVGILCKCNAEWYIRYSSTISHNITSITHDMPIYKLISPSLTYTHIHIYISTGRPTDALRPSCVQEN